MLTADVARMGVQAATAALLLSHTARVWELIVLQALRRHRDRVLQPRVDRTHANDRQRPGCRRQTPCAGCRWG